MGIYKVEIKETLSKIVEQEADTYEDAESLVEERYDNEDIVLYPDNYQGVEYSQYPSPKIKDSFNLTVDFDKKQKDVYISDDYSSGATYKCETMEDLMIAMKTYFNNYLELETENKNEEEMER